MASIQLFLTIITTILVAYVLVVGKAILLPLIIALFLWYLVNALADSFRRVLPYGPHWVRLLLSTLFLLLVLSGPISLISNVLPEVAKSAPEYQQNIQAALERWFGGSAEALAFAHQPLLEKAWSQINIGAMVSGLAGSLTTFAGNTLMICIYLLFLLMEQGSFSKKLHALFPKSAQEKKVRATLNTIYEKVKSYLWIKTLMGALTALISYSIMLTMNLDFASFWAVLIFFLNFIPNIGSIIATLFPALMALVQFEEDITAILIVTGGVGLTQFVIGNVLEPRIMGGSLNLSPMIILLSLVFWGAIWGITGMYLSVPITVIAMIIMAQFSKTRPVAIVLSGNGKV